MKSASIRTVQHQLAALIAEVEKGAEIVITRHRRAVARLAPIAAPKPVAVSSAAVRNYWKRRPLPPAVRSSVSHAALVAEGRGDV